MRCLITAFAFAATCQQSVNKKMQIQKGITGRDVNENQKWMEYEYVIVDEAARVSPRDLMVPMAQGKRIILVGDHRQLPHIIDEEVARQMEEGEASRRRVRLAQDNRCFSIFSLTRLKALEEGDGITRRVTLDKQYRMHPLLGDVHQPQLLRTFRPIGKIRLRAARERFRSQPAQHEWQASRLAGCTSTERKT
jgi:hypothetical protein